LAHSSVRSVDRSSRLTARADACRPCAHQSARGNRPADAHQLGIPPIPKRLRRTARQTPTGSRNGIGDFMRRMRRKRLHERGRGRRPTQTRVAVIKQREKDSGKPRERAARFRRENPELFKERLRAAYWKDPEKQRAAARQWAKENPEKAGALNARNNRRRKAAMRGATDLHPINPIDIFERDGWVWALCGKPISKSRKFPDRLSATLDHTVPISRGGQHTPDNVQAAHYTCNSSKRDRLAVAGLGPPIEVASEIKPEP